MNNDPGSNSFESIKQAVFQGRKIEAIKLYREATGEGLKESKDAIEKMEAELRQSAPEKFSSSAGTKGCAGVLILTLGILAVLLKTIIA